MLDLRWKNYVLFIASLIVYVFGPDVAPLLPGVGFPAGWIDEAQAATKILALILAWLGYSPLKRNPVNMLIPKNGGGK